MNAVQRLGLLGGTFDPIHFGHLDAAEAAYKALRLDRVMVIPAHDPPHKPADPWASAFHRFALVALAAGERSELRVSDVELTRDGPSYTIDTLRAMHRQGWAPSQLFFILGADAFAEIATWHEFPDVLDAAHFAVVARPGSTLDDAVERTPELRPRLGGGRDGVSAGHGKQTRIFLVEARTRDVSSTTVRARLTAGEPIDDLVPASVARHILANQLYATVNHLHGEKQRI